MSLFAAFLKGHYPTLPITEAGDLPPAHVTGSPRPEQPRSTSNNVFATSSLELVPRTRSCLNEHHCLLTISSSSKAVFPPFFFGPQAPASKTNHGPTWPWGCPQNSLGLQNHYLKINQNSGRRKTNARYWNKAPFIKQIRCKNKSAPWTAARRRGHQYPCRWRLESIRNPYFLLKNKMPLSPVDPTKATWQSCPDSGRIQVTGVKRHSISNPLKRLLKIQLIGYPFWSIVEGELKLPV